MIYVNKRLRLISIGGRVITTGEQNGGIVRANNLYMLFHQGHRPEVGAFKASAIRAERIAVTHVSEDHALDNGPPVIELLRDGLTYDVLGLRPGQPSIAPTVRHRYGVAPDLVDSHTEAVSIGPGPHLAAGARSMPVVRTLMGIAAALTKELDGLAAIAWGPAATIVGIEFFRSTVDSWLAGGAFPALGLTGLAPAPDGGLHSEGLAYFTGQELRLEPELISDKTAATQLAIRLINLLVLHGRVGDREAIVGPDGQQLLLTPSTNKKFVRVRRG